MAVKDRRTSSRDGRGTRVTEKEKIDPREPTKDKMSKATAQRDWSGAKTLSSSDEGSKWFPSSIDGGEEETIAKGGVACPFPWRLHEMLEAVEHEGWSDIVSWQPHGRSFKVHNSKSFVEKVLKRFFGQSKYPSFQRQLNIYGFQRFAHGPDKGAYYHDYFVRGKASLVRRMKRQKIKGTKVRRAMAPHEEPDFYASFQAKGGSGKASSIPSDTCASVVSADQELAFGTGLLLGKEFSTSAAPTSSSATESASDVGGRAWVDEVVEVSDKDLDLMVDDNLALVFDESPFEFPEHSVAAKPARTEQVNPPPPGSSSDATLLASNQKKKKKKKAASSKSEGFCHHQGVSSQGRPLSSILHPSMFSV